MSHARRNLYFFVLFPDVQVLTRLSCVVETGNEASVIPHL